MAWRNYVVLACRLCQVWTPNEAMTVLSHLLRMYHRLLLTLRTDLLRDYCLLIHAGNRLRNVDHVRAGMASV